MSAIGTFSAPFATIVPEGVIAYYIKDCDGAAKTLTESDNAYILTKWRNSLLQRKDRFNSCHQPFIPFIEQPGTECHDAFDGTTTAIESFDYNVGDTAIYDLAGRRINKPVKGAFTSRTTRNS